jgi:hypothetical protein
MGTLVKNTTLEIANLDAATLTANGSPVLTVANSTFDNVLYVAKNGNDANDGRSMATPKLTIKSAMSIATSGTAVKVQSGLYTEDCPVNIPAGVAMVGDDVRSVFIQPAVTASDMFYMYGGSYVWGLTVRNYTGKAFSFPPDGSAGLFYVSPYIQNITSMTTTGTTIEIDGSLVSSSSTKAFILGFITSINRGGVGLRMKNRAYSQAVNIYSIAADIGVDVQSGSFISLIASDNGIGNYGIIASGGDLEFTGDLLTTANVGDVGLFFSNVTSPPRTNNGVLVAGDVNMYFISTFSNVTASYPGRGNVWSVNITSRFGATTGNAMPIGTTLSGWQISTVSASSHTFEYVGAGTNPSTALPQYGGIPIPENEVIEAYVDIPPYGNIRGRINWTSTDQKGDFKIGPGLTVVRATGTIEGDDFNRSLFAVMTPYILSIEGI